jgi:hypothetical protein
MKLHLRDERVQPPSSLAFDDTGIDVKDLLLDLQSGAQSKSGSVRIWLRNRNWPRSSRSKARCARCACPAADLTITGSGLDGSAVAPYLKPLGLETTLHNGAIAARAIVNVAQPKPGQLAVSLASHGRTHQRSRP